MTDEVADLSRTDCDRLVNRLIERCLELEAHKPEGQALRGVNANQLDARNNKGGIWYVIESKWSIVAIVIAALSLGIAITTATYSTVAMVQANRELAIEKRLNTAALDDQRMENRAVLRAAGIEPEALENHDISKLTVKAVKP